MATPELISAIASTAMSTIISIVALIFTYRQNVGWPPVALVTDTQLSGVGGQWRFSMKVTVEFWNRRKYPISVRRLFADVNGVTITGLCESEKLYVRNNTFTKRVDALVAPHASHEIEIEVQFENQSLDAMKPLFDISVGYFDPHTKKEAKVQIQHQFFYPELGWSKTDEQRAHIADLFKDLREEAGGADVTARSANTPLAEPDRG